MAACKAFDHEAASSLAVTSSAAMGGAIVLCGPPAAPVTARSYEQLEFLIKVREFVGCHGVEWD